MPNIKAAPSANWRRPTDRLLLPDAGRRELFIISGKENYELNSNKERYLSLRSAFPGTIVTLAFNLNDSVFHSTGSDDTEIIF